MSKWLDEIRLDLRFIKSHTLQPQWYKAFKVVILVGFLAGYSLGFGLLKTSIFLVSFILLSGIVHLAYRAGTRKWQQSWLDFVVVEEQNQIKAKSIGKFYYIAIVLNALIAIWISQALG